MKIPEKFIVPIAVLLTKNKSIKYEDFVAFCDMALYSPLERYKERNASKDVYHVMGSGKTSKL